MKGLKIIGSVIVLSALLIRAGELSENKKETKPAEDFVKIDIDKPTIDSISTKKYEFKSYSPLTERNQKFRIKEIGKKN